MIGLVPTFPTTTDANTSVTPVLLRTANVPANPSSTGAGPCARGDAGGRETKSHRTENESADRLAEMHRLTFQTHD